MKQSWERNVRVLQSDKATPNLTSSAIVSSFLFLCCTMFLTNKCNIACIYLVTAIIKIEVKQRFYGSGLNRVQHIPLKKKTVPFEMVTWL